MSKMKKTLSLLLVSAMTAGISISGTVAYLQSQDSDVNVMTLGSVKIEQHEYQRAMNADGIYKTGTIDSTTSYVLEDFKQAKPLYPIVGDPSKTGSEYSGWDDTVVRMTQVDSYGSMQVFAGKNAQDKFVTVENTGKSDAYIRTLVAFEVGSGDAGLIGSSNHSTWTSNDIGTIEIDGNNYYVKEFVYNGGQLSDGSWRHQYGILPAGDTSYPNLSQVYLKSEATNEDMEAIDGNGNGSLDILVLSQAVQTAGFGNATAAFDAAFPKGTDNKNVAEWFGGINVPTAIYTADALEKALANGEEVALANDITLESALSVTKEVDVNLNGYTLSTKGLAFENGGTIENGTITSAENTNMVPHLKVAGETLTMNNVDVEIDDLLNYQAQGNRAYGECTGMEVANATAILNNCDIYVKNDTSRTWNYTYGITVNNANVIMNGGSITIESAGASITDLETALSGMGSSEVTLNKVSVNAETYGTTMGTLIVNTTDTAVDASRFVSYGGTYTLNYIK